MRTPARLWSHKDLHLKRVILALSTASGFSPPLSAQWWRHMVLLPSQICPFLPHCAEAFRFFLSESISFFTASGMTSSSSSPFPALFFEGWIFMDLTAHVRDIHTWTFWAPPGVRFPPSLQFSPQSSLI